MKRLCLIYLPLLLLLTPALSGCDGAGLGATQVWIDVPLDGAEVEAGTIPVQSHAASGSGVTRVELWVNGELYRSDDNPTPDEPVIYIIQPWAPIAPGEYALQVRAYAADGTHSADGVMVNVSGEAAGLMSTPTAEFVTPTSTPTATPTLPAAPTSTPGQPTDTPAPPTPSPTPMAEIEFWADDETLQAGDCTTIHWNVENVQAVFLDDQGVTGSGTSDTCPCETETHTLDILFLDGTESSAVITINVSGTCPTPTLPPDTTGPPAPTLQSPEDDHVESCAPTHIVLTWQAVSDPSGVSAYDIAVEFKLYGYWQPYWSGQTTKVTPGTVSYNLEPAYPDTTFSCTEYRWRVRAVDGASNNGGWSDWFHFAFVVY